MNARTDSGSVVPMVRADSIRPGDSLVEGDGAMIEVAGVEVTSFVTLTFRSFGVCRVRHKMARLDEMLACVRGKADPLAIATAALHRLAAWRAAVSALQSAGVEL